MMKWLLSRMGLKRHQAINAALNQEREDLKKELQQTVRNMLHNWVHAIELLETLNRELVRLIEMCGEKEEDEIALYALGLSSDPVKVAQAKEAVAAMQAEDISRVLGLINSSYASFMQARNTSIEVGVFLTLEETKHMFHTGERMDAAQQHFLDLHPAFLLAAKSFE